MNSLAEIKTRCGWSTKDPDYIRYHDEEWGVPVYDDRKLFEFLILEGAQAGLSWSTILKRRENYRKAFDGFDAQKVARYSQKKIDSLIQDASIIRNRLKIKSSVTNARAFLKVQEEFGSFSAYQWQFVGGKPLKNKWKVLKDLPAKTKESDLFSADLKKRGFSFVGSTIMYAYMQAIGMVNDHIASCFRSSPAFSSIYDQSRKSLCPAKWGTTSSPERAAAMGHRPKEKTGKVFHTPKTV